MNTETLISYLDTYGYIIIFILLFFGIVGIPAPEESLLLLIGVLTVHQEISITLMLISGILGALTGMLTAYLCGKYIGSSIIIKFGKYVGLTEERWQKVEKKYTRNFKKSILIGFFIPGIRQIIPYFTGMAKYPLNLFILYSLIGSIIWIVPYVFLGYYAGAILNINPNYMPYIGLGFFSLFILLIIFNVIKILINKKRSA